MGLLKFILILAIIYYMAKVIGWLFLHLLARKFSGLGKNNYNEDFQRFNKEAQKEEGKVTIQDKGKHNKNYSKDDGEYTDYEEIH
jgi:hypothetical protein